MSYYTCLVLSGESNFSCFAKCIREQKFSVIKTNSVAELFYSYGYYRPDCVVVDYDTFGSDSLLEAMINDEENFIIDIILVSDEKNDDLSTVTLDMLNNILRERQKKIIESKFVNINKNNIGKASNIVSQKLIQLGLMPKYHGFRMLVDVIVFTCVDVGKRPTLHKYILSSVACNHSTTVTNLTQCIRKLISSRIHNDLYPYDKPTLKQMVMFVSELVKEDLHKVMYDNDEYVY